MKHINLTCIIEKLIFSSSSQKLEMILVSIFELQQTGRKSKQYYRKTFDFLCLRFFFQFKKLRSFSDASGLFSPL